MTELDLETEWNPRCSKQMIDDWVKKYKVVCNQVSDYQERHKGEKIECTDEMRSLMPEYKKCYDERLKFQEDCVIKSKDDSHAHQLKILNESHRKCYNQEIRQGATAKIAYLKTQVVQPGERPSRRGSISAAASSPRPFGHDRHPRSSLTHSHTARYDDRRPHSSLSHSHTARYDDRYSYPPYDGRYDDHRSRSPPPPRRRSPSPRRRSRSPRRRSRSPRRRSRSPRRRSRSPHRSSGHRR